MISSKCPACGASLPEDSRVFPVSQSAAISASHSLSRVAVVTLITIVAAGLVLASILLLQV